MSQAVLPTMKGQGTGRIISASSFAAIVPSIGSAAYRDIEKSKAGVESFTRVLAGELGASGVTVNCYAPGMIPTEMNHYAERTDVQEGGAARHPDAAPLGQPEGHRQSGVLPELGLASYITGTMIDISGGKFATQAPWAA